MPFFRPAYISPEASFFQLLSELDQPQQKQCAPRHHRAQTFTPKFDVTEVENAYELYGELPGIEQSDITIEFSDAQTLVIKGKTERASDKVEATQPQASTSTTDNADASSEKSHNPTVEDEYDEADTPLATPATTATVTAEEKQEQAAEPQAQTPKPKYWVAERRVGNFARSFSFSQRIEHEAVQASLKNGILRVVVPKSQKTGRIAVNVL